MALVPRKLKGGRVVYWIANKMNGAIVYERSGLDKREAERRDAAMKREIKAGTYAAAKSDAATVAGYSSRWLTKRTNRAADNEADMWRNHVVKRCPWFGKMKMRDVRPKHILRLVTELAQPYEGAKTIDGKLAPKMVSGIYGVCKTMFRDARIDEVVDVDPCVLPKDTLSRQPRTARKPYGAGAALAMMTEPAVRWDRRVWNAIAFYTGMREGEVCGRRWRDWDPQCSPLGAITCATQYKDQPLKTEKHGGERPRIIPVHPELDRILREWWETGFELVFCRRPTLDDFIVPHETIGCHTKSSGYKAWRKSCVEAGVGNISLHSTRNTFITWTRRCGARKEVLERVTHNARGDIVDRYTAWDWRPLCEAVACLRYDTEQLDSRLDQMRLPLGFRAPAPGLEP